MICSSQSENAEKVKCKSILSFEHYLVLDDQTPTSNLSKQNFIKSSQNGLLNTGREEQAIHY